MSLAGYEARLVNLVDHVVGEVFYSGAWHVLDPDIEVYFRNSQGLVASAEEIAGNNQILNSPVWLKNIEENKKNIVTEVLIKTYSEKPWRYTPAAESIKNKEYQSELIYRLRPKEEIRFYYYFKGRYYWGFEDKRPPEFTNGVLISQNQGGFFRWELPFPIVAA